MCILHMHVLTRHLDQMNLPHSFHLINLTDLYVLYICYVDLFVIFIVKISMIISFDMMEGTAGVGFSSFNLVRPNPPHLLLRQVCFSLVIRDGNGSPIYPFTYLF